MTGARTKIRGEIVPDDETLLRLVGDIYDAALNAQLWSGVLEHAAQFVRGSAASLYAKDIANKTGNVAFQFGLDPHYEQLYMQKYINSIRPRLAILLRKSKNQSPPPM